VATFKAWFLKYLYNHGLSLRTRLLRVVVLASSPTFLVMGAIYGLLGATSSALACAGFGLFAGLLIPFIQEGKAFHWCLGAFIVLSTLTIYLKYILTGHQESPVLFGLVVPFLLLSIVLKKRSFTILIVVFLAITLGVAFFGLPPKSVSNAPKEATALLTLIYFAGILTVLVVGAVYMKKDYLQNEQRLNEYLRKLREKQKDLEKSNLELQEAGKQKDRLFSIIGHDLRNPLSSIEGYLDLILSEKKDHRSKEENEILEQLLSLTKQSRNLLDNLLEWGKRDSNPSFTPIPIRPAVETALETLRPIATKKRIALELLLDAPQVRIIGDQNMLSMIVRNLVSNAIKFTHEGGTIKICSYTYQASITLEVEDNGVGMTADQAEQLFTPQRTIREGTAQEQGIGLGLILCKEYTQKMKGQISCSSIPSKGSCFKISFSLAE
jgi:signal transduction histidine kinase